MNERCPGSLLADLLGGSTVPASAAMRGRRVAEVRDDSRAGRRGDLFVAVPGATVDGREFLAAAVGAGRRGAGGRGARRRPSWRRSPAWSWWCRTRGRRWASSRANRYRRPPTRWRCRRDRHQRQDDHDVPRRGDAARGGRRPGVIGTVEYRYRRAGRRAAGAVHHARRRSVARAVRRDARGRRTRRGDGGDVARARRRSGSTGCASAWRRSRT